MALEVERGYQTVMSWIAERDQLGIDPEDPRRRTPEGDLKLPVFVKFHYLDPGSDCDPIFWQDPLTFSPRRGRHGYIDSWGIYPHDDSGFRDIDFGRIMSRKSRVQLHYSKDKPTPEVQFINALIYKKVTQLADLDLTHLRRRDFILYISVPFIPNPHDSRSDRYWRRLRVSGGLPLAVFSDKVLTPLWGWVRNLHAHIFHDYKDGALFGPKECDATDLTTYIDLSGYAYIPEEESVHSIAFSFTVHSPLHLRRYTIAHILQKEGDVMGYHYDFGDNWWVDIKLEEIAPSDESTGVVTVLDGAGGVLPDGEQTGLFKWGDYLKQAARSPAGKRKVVRILFGATNFSGKTPPIDSLEYDFDAFDMERTRQTIRDALDSKGSLPYASKKFVTPLSGRNEMYSEGDMRAGSGRAPKDMKKGTVIFQTDLNRSDGTFLEEGINMTRRDNPANTACANCGTPHGLKACKQCGQRYYCGKECQRTHWREGHKRVCKKGSN